MPCRDDRDDNCSVTAIATAEAAAEKSAYLLCEACALLEEAGVLSQASNELKAWYKLHEALEADRVRLEAAQKLTVRERRLLGIDLTELKLQAQLNT
jgi:hypothetical protein